MSNTGKKIGQYVNKLSDILSGRDETERLIFRRFKGDKILEILKTGRNIVQDEKDLVDKVVLRVNPVEISFTKKKIIQKIPTSAPGRFIVFDWGSELTILGIKGNTGNLLPEFITDGGPNPLFTGVLEDTLGVVDPNAAAQVTSKQFKKTVGLVSSALQNVALNSMTYMELLNASPKYKTFKKLFFIEFPNIIFTVATNL